MPPDHPDRCLKCSRQLPCWYHPIPNPNAPPPPIKKMPKFVSRPDTYHASQILKPHPPLQTPHPLTNNPTHHLDHRHLLHLHLPSPPPAPPPPPDSKDVEKDKFIYAEAQRLPWAHYDRLRRFVRLFRCQVSRAEPGAFKEAIDKLEDKAIAWVIELDKIEEIRKRWFKEED